MRGGLVLSRPFGSMIEAKAFQSLQTNVQHFSKLLGEPRREGDGFAFPTNDLLFQSLFICYEIERKFLGKIHVMLLEGKFLPGEMFPLSERMELRYSGFFRKGKPFFIPVPPKMADSSGNRALKILNQDQALLNACWKLDVEFLRVFFDPGEKAWKVQVRPYGGSFIKIVLPPLQYNVLLSREQTEIILSVINRIGELIARSKRQARE
jgi:hypothetical protein